MALLTASAPAVSYLVASLYGSYSSQSYVWWGFSGQCPGRQVYDLIEYPERTLVDFPLFSYGGAPLILLGFAGWCLGVRKGHVRAAKVVARSVAAVPLLLHLPEPLLFTLDSAIDSACSNAWGPPEIMDQNVAMGLYYLIPSLLVLLAVRTPRPPAYVRRGPLVRTLLAALTVMVTVLFAVESVPPGRVSSEEELDCAGFGDGTVTGLSKAEKIFLCDVRGYGFSRGQGEVPGWSEVSDHEVLAQGHQLCDLAVQHGGDVNAPAVQQAPQASLTQVLAGLCPAVAEARKAEDRRQDEEEKAYVAKKEKDCAVRPAHQPKIRALRQKRATMWTEFWTIDGWDEGYEGTVPELVKNLVGSERGALSIWAADEIGQACVTVEAYSRRPPLEIKGWEEVVEVGYESPSGSLTLVDGRGKRLPGLTPAGPGLYRVRVHLRGRKLVEQRIHPPDGAVQLLIMVFPGGEKAPVVYR